MMEDVRKPSNRKNYRPIETFAKDCKEGNLPDYTWIDPRWTDFLYNFPSNDQHPPHSMKHGEFLIAHIYKHIRASPLWNSSLFIVMYDEHGGFYDHSPPPQQGVPSPDGKVASDGFQFNRLGVRTPFVMASPWINYGSAFHSAPASSMPTPTSQFDHTSVPATLKKIFNLPDFLTDRDAWANTFEFVVDNNRTEPRTDCPMTLPTVGRREEYDSWESNLLKGISQETLLQGKESANRSLSPVTSLQKSILLGICGAAYENGRAEERSRCSHAVSALANEHEAAIFAHEMTAKFLSI
jgi:phospholipase C